jgi:hypothetical protein
MNDPRGILMRHTLALAAATLLCAGCASVMNDATHPMKVETKTAAGEVIPGADCLLINDYGSLSLKSGDTAQVRRSNKTLDIRCKLARNPDATARVISRINSGMLGNIATGGIGALIDHNTGSAYTYPAWVQLVFGKALVFDRTAEHDGQPVAGTEAAASP